MGEIKKVFGVNSIEVDKEEGKLFLEDSSQGGLEIDLNHIELMWILDKHTDEDIDAAKAAYGIDKEEFLP